MLNSKIINTYKGVEKRQSPRLEKVNNFIFYKLQELTGRETQEVKESYINNISGSGLCCDTLEPINSSITLEGEIYQPLDNQRNIIIPIFIVGKVIWVKKIDNGGEFGSNKYRLGLKFLRQIKERIIKRKK